MRETGNAGPRGDDARDIFFRDFFVQQSLPGRFLAQRFFGAGQLLLQLGNLAVLDLRGQIQVACALGLFQFDFGLLELAVDDAHGIDRGLFILPLRLKLGGLFFEIGQILFEASSAALCEASSFSFFSAFCSISNCMNLPFELVDFRRHRVQFHAQTRGRFIDQVDGFVGQKSVGDVAMRKRGGRDQGGILDANAVMDFVPLFQAAQNGDGCFDGRFGDQHRLKAAFERRIFFDVLAIFVERRRADGPQFATRQLRFHDIGGVGGAFRRAGADERVQFVDEQNDLALRWRRFLSGRL